MGSSLLRVKQYSMLSSYCNNANYHAPSINSKIIIEHTIYSTVISTHNRVIIGLHHLN